MIRPILILLMMVFGAQLGLAQVEGVGLGISHDFVSTLQGLKNSVTKLKSDNANLDVKNNQIKEQLRMLKDQLDELTRQEMVLNKAMVPLTAVNEKRAKQIADLTKELFDLMTKSENADQRMKQAQQELLRLRAQDDQLNQRLVDLSVPRSVPTINGNQVNVVKERARLLKMIDDSKAAQAMLIDRLGSLEAKAAPVKEQDQTALQIAQLRADVATLTLRSQQAASSAVSATGTGYSDNEIKALENQLGVLQKNSDELQVLVEQMRQRYVKMTYSQDAKIEQNKLALSLDNLNSQDKLLRQDLARLRKQMVELDKQKTRLQALLAQ